MKPTRAAGDSQLREPEPRDRAEATAAGMEGDVATPLMLEPARSLQRRTGRVRTTSGDSASGQWLRHHAGGIRVPADVQPSWCRRRPRHLGSTAGLAAIVASGGPR